MMKKTILLAAAALSASAFARVDLFVAPDGDDSNPGTEARPLATPRGACAALRAMRAADPTLRSAGAVVTFADGTYRLDSAVVLGEEDSGAPGAPVVWRAKNSTKAVFSGGVALRTWKRLTEAEGEDAARALVPQEALSRVIVAEVPAGIELPGFRGGGCGTAGHLQEHPIALFQAGERLVPARWPNDGFASAGRPMGDPAPGRTCSGEFEFPKERLARWAKEPELWAYGLWRFEWADACVRVIKVQSEGGSVTVDSEPIGFGLREGAQFHVMNALSELDRPGEWAVDRARRRIYLWPKAKAYPMLAAADGLVRAKGLREFVIGGFVFECSRTTALKFEKCERTAVIKSVICRCNSWGVDIAASKGCRVDGCDLYDLGEGGVHLDGGVFETLEPGCNAADNNHIHHYGLVIPNYKQGVRLDGVGNRATHNLIHHTRHQAVEFNGNDHYVGWNIIHDTCTFNDDAGAIYCCQRDWTKRGTVVEHNLIHMTGKQPRATNDEAIYLDDYSSGTIVRWNVINRATSGVFVGGGNGNEIYGNLVMNASRSVTLSSRGIDSFSKKVAEKGRDSEIFRHLERRRDLFEGALWRERYPELLKVYDMDPVKAHDSHWNRITNNVFVASGAILRGNWKNIEATTTIAGNLETKEDPGFADYFGMDWTLAPGPARDLLGDLRIGDMGLYDSWKRVTPPVRVGDGITPPRALRPEYAPAKVRIDVVADSLPDGVKEMAEGCVGCCVPGWGGGRRIFALDDALAPAEWTEFSFSFVPTFDGEVRLDTMGARGEKTLYDAFRVEGASLENAGFEADGAWGLPSVNPKDDRIDVCNTEKPWGVLTAAEAKCDAAEGKRMACGNDMLNFTQRMKVRKGVRVTVKLMARALPD